eukprot:461585-Alexandrium_andersonii.AAC.1
MLLGKRRECALARALASTKGASNHRACVGSPSHTQRKRTAWLGLCTQVQYNARERAASAHAAQAHAS